MEFSKNRLGPVGQKMYFNFDSGVTFDEQRYTRDLLNDAMLAEEREKLESEDGAFDALFGNLESNMPTEGETVELDGTITNKAEVEA